MALTHLNPRRLSPDFQNPWNNWYHLMGHTYGSWLPGDPRGFRTQRHREHIHGDYKSPPRKGVYDGLHKHSKSALKRQPVYLNRQQRAHAVRFMVESLERRKIEVIIASVDALHFHILARVRDRRVEHWIGIAKRETSHYMKEAGIGVPGGLWATRAKSQPIKDRQHQLATVRYILAHRTKGAAIWFRGKVLSSTKA